MSTERDTARATPVTDGGVLIYIKHELAAIASKLLRSEKKSHNLLVEYDDETEELTVSRL